MNQKNTPPNQDVREVNDPDTMRTTPPHESSVGPIVGIVIILIIIVLGGYFFLTSKTELIEDNADEIEMIEADLQGEGAELENLDEEFDELDAELQALDQELEQQ